MKKLLALILAAALALSLVACGGDSGAGDTNTPSGGNGNVTKDEMLESAFECNFHSMERLYKSNKLNAQENYCGKTYKFTGIVVNIEADHITAIPMYFPFDSNGNILVNVDIFLSEDELKQLSTNELVNFVGEISELSDNGTAVSVKMEHGYYVDKEVTLTGISKEKYHNFDPEYYEYTFESLNESIFFYYTVRTTAEEAERLDSKEGNNYIVTGTMKMKSQSISPTGGHCELQLSVSNVSEIDRVE